MEHVNKFKAAAATLTGVLTALWGWMGWLVLGWILCMGLDYLAGSLAAAKTGNWNSARAREGIWHKCGMIVVVMVAAGVDLLLSAALEHLPGVELPFAFGGLVCPMVLVWYIITELGSIAENGVELGAPVPGWLIRLLKAGKDAVDTAGNKITGEAAAVKSVIKVDKDGVQATVVKESVVSTDAGCIQAGTIKLEGIQRFGDIGDNMPGMKESADENG